MMLRICQRWCADLEGAIAENLQFQLFLARLKPGSKSRGQLIDTLASY